ncbi:MAG: GH25 family lysozyme [Oscillospiraceae bacterium]
MIATMKKRWGLRLCSLLLSLVLAVPLAGAVLAAGPSSQTEYAGIDVSEWQGDIDFAKVKADGISVVYIRASVGRYTDPYFQRNYQNAKANGLAVGFYHYLTARTVPQAREEAAYFASVVAKTKPDCHLVMDFEYFSGLSRAQINAIAQAFLEALEEATGRTAAIYTNANSAQNLFDTALAKYPLWVADWSGTAGFGPLGGLGGVSVLRSGQGERHFRAWIWTASPPICSVTMLPGDSLCRRADHHLCRKAGGYPVGNCPALWDDCLPAGAAQRDFQSQSDFPRYGAANFRFGFCG